MDDAAAHRRSFPIEHRDALDSFACGLMEENTKDRLTRLDGGWQRQVSHTDFDRDIA